jgi:hypothetical protein
MSVMIRKVAVVTTDDLAGSPGAEMVSFALDRVSYQIDLAQANKVRLADAVAPFTWGRPQARPGRPAAGYGPASAGPGGSRGGPGVGSGRGPGGL